MANDSSPSRKSEQGPAITVQRGLLEWLRTQVFHRETREDCYARGAITEILNNSPGGVCFDGTFPSALPFSDAAPSETVTTPEVQDIMWEVFEYGDRSHAFHLVRDKPECPERTAARDALLEQDAKLRKLLASLPSATGTIAVPRQLLIDWFDASVRQGMVDAGHEYTAEEKDRIAEAMLDAEAKLVGIAHQANEQEAKSVAVR